MSTRRNFIKIPPAAALAGALTLSASPALAQQVSLLNVSYDPARELYVEFNQASARYWKGKTGQDVAIKQSHGGSGKQARSVIDGLDADMVTLALAGDVDALNKNGKLIPADWQKRLPHNSAPYTSTIVFLVRKDNPKSIEDWDDLTKPGVAVVTPNPKTSGGARWNYLVAWELAKRRYGGDAKAREYVGKLYGNGPVLDTRARGATISFAQRSIGDVLLAWENDGFLALKEFGGDKFEIVAPSISVLAEPTASIVDKNVDKKGTRAVAGEYLKYLYSDEGQDIAGKNFYRPISDKAQAKYAKQFPKLALFTIDQAFGGWAEADKDHFADGGSFDQIYAKK